VNDNSTFSLTFFSTSSMLILCRTQNDGHVVVVGDIDKCHNPLFCLVGSLAFSLVDLDCNMVFTFSRDFTTPIEACVKSEIMLHFVAIIIQTLVSIQLDG
jgi:hypothetical protein